MKAADENKAGVIFNIQKFSVNDGPGIRTVVFFKGCPLRCRWCANPESQLAKPQILWNQKKCIHCHHCIEICPSNAVSIKKDCIIFDPLKCSSCQRCVSECPQKALENDGYSKTIKEVMDIVTQDLVFYEESGGGITLSGGEILSQPEFAIELLLASKRQGLHTCCETTGFAKPELFRKVIKYVDYILFDMKHWNPKTHKAGTGVTNKLPLANMKYSIDAGKEVLPRIPVIPGFNNSLEDAAKLAEALHSVGANRCQLLPFHQFGENKYHLLNYSYEFENVPSLHREDLQEYIQVFLNAHINAFF
ncbi:MAG: glycyl-radical enzyme activating protein [Eubacteriales bacterium]|nr:glycyl-radical enzyme activating protein [Eubacteriales bacterium]